MRLQPVQDPFRPRAGAVRLDGSTSWLERQAGREVAHAGHTGAATLGGWPRDLRLMTQGPALLQGTVEIVEHLGGLEIAYVVAGGPKALSLRRPGTSAVARGVRMGPIGQLHLFDAKRRQLAV